ncbi:DNA polymerase III subunit gamma/tau [Bartonella sp. B41]
MEQISVETNYHVLARKYRPKNFSDLIGQTAMVHTLTNAFQTGRIAQAWMLTGIRGVGKTTTARILARALNYKTKDINRPTTELNTLGEHCIQIIEGRHIDVIEMDAASHTGIDDIREIIEQIRYRPVSARYKIYIIDEVHMLSTQAFNGLLKTLEEPPQHVKFIFATTEIRKVPITILSRCQRFDLRRVESAVLVKHLRQIAQHEKVEIEDQALSIIARSAEGSVRDALSIFDQAISHGNGNVSAITIRAMLGLADQSRIIDLFEFIMKGNIVNALHELRSQYDAGATPLAILTELADFNHLVTRLRFTPEVAEDFSLTEEERLRSLDLSQKLSIPILSRNWQMLLKGIQEISQTERPLQAAEMLLIRLTHAADLPTLDEALTKITQENTPFTVIQSSSNTLPNLPNFSLQPNNVSRIKTPKNMNPLEVLPSPETIQSITTSENIDQKTVIINSLHDLVELAEQNNDIPFKVHIKEFVHPVSFKPNHITLRLTDSAPPSLPRDIEKTLFKWTRQRWTVTLVKEGGGPTLQEESIATKEALISDAKKDPDIMKIFNHFPKAKIVDIRLNKQENNLDLLSDTIKSGAHTNNG